MKGAGLLMKAFQYIVITTMLIFGIITWYNSSVYMNINKTTVNVDKYMNAVAAYAQKNNGFNDIPGTSFENYKNEMKFAFNIDDNIVSESYTPSGIVRKGQECVIRITPKVPSYLGIFEGKASNYTQLPTREIRFYSHHFIRDVNI